MIEVHLTNIHAREEFRRHTLTGEVVASVIAGMGPFGYHLAMIGMTQILNEMAASQQAQA